MIMLKNDLVRNMRTCRELILILSNNFISVNAALWNFPVGIHIVQFDGKMYQQMSK